MGLSQPPLVWLQGRTGGTGAGLERGPGGGAAEYNENEGQVEPQLVVDACIRRLAELEAGVLAGVSVVGLPQAGDGTIRAVQTTSGDIEVDAVVLAAGTDTTALAALAGVNVPQAESPGVVMRTTPMPPLLRNVPVVYAPAAGERPSGNTPEAMPRRAADDRRG